MALAHLRGSATDAEAQDAAEQESVPGVEPDAGLGAAAVAAVVAVAVAASVVAVAEDAVVA